MSKSIAQELEAFVAVNKPTTGPQCNACKLPSDIRAAVEEQADKGTVKSVIAKWLRSKGYQVSDFTMRRHVRDHRAR